MVGAKYWLSLIVVLSLALIAAYGVGQQVLRQSANDPQIQLAEDWAAQVESGTDVTHLSLGSFIDPTQSLATFGIVYDQSGNIANSSVAAPSTMAQPDGIFGSVDRAANHEIRFTWQPSSGARYATVIKRATFQDKTYYMLAGRNLREVEKRENNLLVVCAIGWFAALAVLLIIYQSHHAAPLARRVMRRKGV